ncbi:MFS transporter [Carbonactinospora thermoautotrophica]|uniref:MFS transporter n=1 Tax=Carbonactinospora thermoautotrophica TaxID=1469144 RepID=UPI00226D5ADD|nr:MFS transporter [Carbonactinospora thermoautotrophica]
MTPAPSPVHGAAPARTRLPRAFWLLWAGTFVNRVGTFVAPYLILYLTRERHIDPVVAGLLLTLQGCGLVVSNLVGGALADRCGRRPTIIAGLGATAVTLLVLAVARSAWQLAVALLVLGVVTDLHRPALNAVIADLLPPEVRARAYSLLHWAVNLGMPVAVLVGGVLSEHGFWLLFAGDAFTTGTFAALVWRFLPEAGGASTRLGPAALRLPRVVSPRPALVTFAAVSFVAFLVYFQNWTTVPLAVIDAGLTNADYGAVMAINGVVVAGVQPAVAGALDRGPRSALLAGSYLLVGVGFGLTALAGSLPAFAVTVVLWSLGEIGLAALGPAFVADLAPAHLRGRYLGVYGAAVAAGAAAAPLAGTAVYRADPGLLWAVCGGAGVLMAATQVVLGRITARGAGRGGQVSEEGA